LEGELSKEITFKLDIKANSSRMVRKYGTFKTPKNCRLVGAEGTGEVAASGFGELYRSQDLETIISKIKKLDFVLGD
jgi:hypothetical protein